MTIWKTPFTLDDLKKRGLNTMVEFLGIEFTEIGEDFLVAEMSVDNRTRQPLGIMHGGASCVLAESVGSAAANYCVDLADYYCVGLDINTNHIRQAKEGCFVVAKAVPHHLGKTTQVWGIEICEKVTHKLVSINRLTMLVLKRSK